MSTFHEEAIAKFNTLSPEERERLNTPPPSVPFRDDERVLPLPVVRRFQRDDRVRGAGAAAHKEAFDAAIAAGDTEGIAVAKGVVASSFAEKEKMHELAVEAGML